MKMRSTRILYAILSFAFILMMGAGRLCAQTATANTLQHPKDQIALQLGAIQMGYTVPFTLTGNISVPKMQQAVNALVMGRNALDATVAKPAVKVVGAVDSPSVDTVEYRDQLYAAVEYVVTSPVVATIKGSSTVTGNKKVSVAATKLTLPTNAWTIPVPYALESRSSADVEALSGNVTDLASQVASIGGNLTSTASTISGLSGNLTTLQTQASGLTSNVSQLQVATAPLTEQTVISTLAYSAKNPNVSGEEGYTGIAVDQAGNVYVGSQGALGGGEEGVFQGIQKITASGISTLAGSSTGVGAVDGNGTAASFNNPIGVALDGSGNVYVADIGNNRIRKITPSGNVTTLAGSGNASFADGNGALASFNHPAGIAVDGSGNVYVADMGNNRIRKITPSGNVTTLAGSGNASFADGQGIAASFDYPLFLALDGSGYLYVTDIINGRIRKITANGNVSTLVSGLDPFGISLDTNGTIYVSEGRCIYKIQTKFQNIASNLGTVQGQVTSVSNNASAAVGAVNALSGNVTTLASEQNYKLAQLEATIQSLRDELVAAGVLYGGGGNATADMIPVQGGTLPASSGLGNQTVATFQIGKYEVAWGEWKTVRDWAVTNGYSDLAGIGGTYPSGSADNFPVINVSWYDVVKWSNARSEKEGLTPVYRVSGTTYKTGESLPSVNSTANGYRLPSEKEWEWAARGGVSSQGYTYSGSNTASVVAWTYENSSDGTKAVGTKAANELGIYDMSGNVWEWCEDVAYSSYRRIRGGSWSDDFDVAFAAVANRDYYNIPVIRDNDFGFRLARSSGN